MDEYQGLIERIREAIPANSRAHADCDKLEIFCRAHMPLNAPEDFWAKYQLQMMEARVAKLLYAKLNTTVSKDQLVDRVWFDRDEPAQMMKTVDVYISKIRRKLANSPYRIETVWGTGFRMIEDPKAPLSTYPQMWTNGRAKHMAARRARSRAQAAEAA